MKYYAVTEDPNELFHYGVKGMKWGKHIFGDKQKSAGYKKAASKLRASLKNGIKNTQTKWKQSSEARSVRKERQAEMLADRRLNEALGAQAMKSARKEQRAIRNEMRKEAFDKRREQRQLDRYMDKARRGTLKYKRVSNDQIEAITERLNLENQARRLSGNEQPHFLTRIKRSIGEGVVRGVGSAVAVGIEERARGKARYDVQRKYGAKSAREQAKEQRIRDRSKIKSDRKNAKMQARAEADKDFYEMQAELGERRAFKQTVGINARKNRMKELNEYKKNKKQEDFDDEVQQTIIRNYINRTKADTDADKYLGRFSNGSWKANVRSLTPDYSNAFTPSSFKTQRLTDAQRQQRINKGSRPTYASAANHLFMPTTAQVKTSYHNITPGAHQKQYISGTASQLPENPSYYNGSGGSAYPRSRTKRRSKLRRVDGLFNG